MKRFKFVMVGLVCLVSIVNGTIVSAQQIDLKENQQGLDQDNQNNLALQQNNQQDLTLDQDNQNNLALQQNNQQDLTWNQDNQNNLALQQEIQRETGISVEQQQDNLVLWELIANNSPEDIKLKFQSLEGCSFLEMADMLKSLTDSEFEYFMPIMVRVVLNTLHSFENGEFAPAEMRQSVLLKGSVNGNSLGRLVIKSGDFFGEDKIVSDNYGGFCVDESVKPVVDRSIYLNLVVPKEDEVFKDIDKIYIEFKRLLDGKTVLIEEGMLPDAENSELICNCVSILKDCLGFSESRVNRIMERALPFIKERCSKFLEMTIAVNKDNFYDFENKVGDLEEYEINIYKDSLKKEKIASSEGTWKFDVNIVKRLMDRYR